MLEEVEGREEAWWCSGAAGWKKQSGRRRKYGQHWSQAGLISSSLDADASRDSSSLARTPTSPPSPPPIHPVILVTT